MKMMLRKIGAIATQNSRTQKMMMMIGIGCLTWGMGTEAIFARNVEILHVERFDEGPTVGWKFYDNSLDYYEPGIDDKMTYQGSQGALLGQGNASGMSLLKLLRQSSVSIPIEDDVYLGFAFYCEAKEPADDEISIYLEGHDEAGGSIHRTIPVALGPGLNRWHYVSMPMSACGVEVRHGQMNGLFSLVWNRGVQDAHNLRIDDFQITRGSSVIPTLLHPGTFRVVSDGVVVAGRQYGQRLRISARLFQAVSWTIQLVDPRPSGETVLKTYQGTGRQVDVFWDGKDSREDLVRTEQVEVRLTMNASPLGHTPIIETKRVLLYGGEFSRKNSEKYAILTTGETTDFDDHTAMDRVLLPQDRTNEFELLGDEGINLRVQSGSRTGILLKVVRVTGERTGQEDLSLHVEDLVGEEGGPVLSSANVRFRRVIETSLDFGFILRETKACNESLNVPSMLELSVEAAGYLRPGIYQGLITIGHAIIPLSVTVEKRTRSRLWWQDEKIRLMLAKPQVMPRQEYFYDTTKGYQQIARAGFNVMIPYISVSDQAFISGKAELYDLKSIARTHAPAYPRESFHEPYFVWPTGFKTELMCPFSDAFWKEAIVPQASELAEVSKGVSLVGMEFDFEIYGVDGKDKFAHIYCHCYCDSCWNAVREHDQSFPDLAAQKRHTWLRRQHRLGEYKVFQDGRLRKHARQVRVLVDRINPDLQFMLLAWGAGDFLQILAQEWGSERAPVILSTESPYGRGRTPLGTAAALAYNRDNCINGIRTAKRMGLKGLYVPGVMPGYQKADPVFCRANAEILSRTSDGYWVFFQQVEPPSNVRENMKALSHANATIIGER